MNSAVARLLAQVEAGLGDMGRRTAESFTTPIRVKSQELIAETIGNVTAAARTLAIKAALALFAGTMLVVALVFALSALYGYLDGLMGPIDASLCLAGLFVVLAILAGVALAAWPSATRPVQPTPTTKQREVEQARLVMEASAKVADLPLGTPARVNDAPNTEQALRSGLDAVVAALGDAGFVREQAGLRAGLTIAQQLRPMQVVSLALLGGFLAGIRMQSRRRPRKRR